MIWRPKRAQIGPKKIQPFEKIEKMFFEKLFFDFFEWSKKIQTYLSIFWHSNVMIRVDLEA